MQIQNSSKFRLLSEFYKKSKQFVFSELLRNAYVRNSYYTVYLYDIEMEREIDAELCFLSVPTYVTSFLSWYTQFNCIAGSKEYSIQLRFTCNMHFIIVRQFLSL